MNVKFSSLKFPVNPSVKDGSGTVWGCVLQPFRNNHVWMENASRVDRCKKCFGYINPYVTFDVHGSWTCSICHHTNKLQSIDQSNRDPQHRSRLYLDPEQRMLCPEIANTKLVLRVDNEDENNTSNDEKSSIVDDNDDNLSTYRNNPIYIALVDISGNNEQMEVIKNGLDALIHALPDNTLFGMIVYSYKIGVFNLNCSSPSVKYIDVISPTDISFEDILPISGFLVNKSKFESNILNAISILPYIDSSVNSKKGGSIRALGPTIDLLIDYLAFDNITFHVKVGVYMTGRPTHGNGSVEREYSTTESLYPSFESKDFLSPSSLFFKKKAEEAIQVGTHFDLYAIGNGYFGFETIKYLCNITGGNLYRYSNLTSTCSLPQDIYKLVSAGWGFHGLLRIRCSKNYSVDNCFGNLSPSKSFKDLYHIESCSSFTSIAFDFKFTDPSAFESKEQPFIQIAFSYSYLPPLEIGNELSDSIDKVKNNTRVIEKRLHIFNASIPIANTPADLLENNIDIETTISLITHKIIKESLEKGIRESRLMLIAWLGNFITKYNENVVILSSVKTSVDLTFSKMPHLRPLPRYVFALLKGDLLKVVGKANEDHVLESRSDDWIYTQMVYASLEPRMLHRAIYPVLCSYGAPNNLSSKYVTLSHTSITTSIAHIYLLDAYDTLVVYYAPQAVASGHPFPPPPDTLIRQTIANSKQDRLIVPRIEYTKGNLLEATQFSKYLFEDDNLDNNNSNNNNNNHYHHHQTYFDFLHDLEDGLKKFLTL